MTSYYIKTSHASHIFLAWCCTSVWFSESCDWMQVSSKVKFSRTFISMAEPKGKFYFFNLPNNSEIFEICLPFANMMMLHPLIVHDLTYFYLFSVWNQGRNPSKSFCIVFLQGHCQPIWNSEQISHVIVP